VDKPSALIWIGLAFAYLAVGGIGSVVLFHLARRELSGRRAAPFAEFVRALEVRVEWLLMHPPDWRIWRVPSVQKLLLGATGAVLAALAVWALWTHAGTWFADKPAAALPAASPVFPFESLTTSVMRSSMWNVAGAVGFVAGMAAFVFGSARNGAAVITAAFLCFSMPHVAAFAFSDTVSVDELATGDPPWATAAPSSPSPPTPPPRSLYEEPHPAALQPERALEAEPSSMLPRSAAPTAHDQSHFGITNALLLYGLYHSVTDDHATRTWPSPRQQISPVRTEVPQATTPRAATPQAVPLRAAAPQPQPASSSIVPRGSSTYKPFTGRVSSFGSRTRRSR
jgi:hypothetical protein